MLARIPSLFEPNWYGDEAIYLTIGQAINEGVPLYSGIHDNKPPFLYLLAALASGYVFWFKFIALGWTLVTVMAFFHLAKKVFEDSKWCYWTTGIFAFLTSWPKLEGNIANAELFFLLPTIVAIYWLWDARTNRDIFKAGVIVGFGALFKMPAALEAGIWPIYWLFSKDKLWVKKTLALSLGVFLPIGLSLVYYLNLGSLEEYFTAAWAQNLPYLSSWKSSGEGGGVFSLTGRAVVMGMGILGVMAMSRVQEKRLRIVGTWGVVTLFACLLSGRPYPHYLIQGVGVLAVAAGLILSGNPKEKGVAIAVIGGYLLATQVFKFWGYEVISYYRNFGEFLVGQKSREQYFAWFSPRVNQNYSIAEKVRNGSKPGEKIFVWADEPMIYSIARRLPVGKYTVAYHIKDFDALEETIVKLADEKPKFVVSFGNEKELPGLEELLKAYYVMQQQVGEATIYRRLLLYN